MIRKYQSNDLENVVDIFRSNIPKYFDPSEEDGLRDFLSKETEDYYVVEFDGDVVGAGGIAVNEDDATVSLCWGMIRDDHIGIGLGRQLTQFRIKTAEEKFPGLALVIKTSQHTKGFYEKFGFQLTEHTPDGFARGIDTCKMRRE